MPTAGPVARSEEEDSLTRLLGAALSRICSQPVAVKGLQRLSGGASQESWALRAVSSAGPEGLPLVLRRSPAGATRRNPLAAGMACEAALLALAARHGVPVPRLFGTLRAEDGLGEGFVMHHLAGETRPQRILRDEGFAAARASLAWQCGQALARIHALPHDRLPTLRCSLAAEELALYRNRHAQAGIARPVFELAFQWLHQHLPAQAVTPVLVHGDFRHGNLMVGPGGLVGVLDWELAHLGDPMEDLGWICVNSWRFGHSALPVGGFGTVEQLVAGYEAAGGRASLARLHYWQVLGSLKWGIMCETMARAWQDGSERVVEKAAIGRRASEAELDLLNLICPRP